MGSCRILWVTIFIISLETTRTAAFQNYGCDFADDKYALHSSTPVWGKDQQVMNIKKRIDLDFLANRMRVASYLVVNSSCYDDISSLVRFCRAYKNQTKFVKDLAGFYKDYKYEFQPSEDSVSFEVTFLNNLKRDYPDIGKYFYFVSAFTEATRDPNDNVDKVSTEIREDFFHGHVAVVLRFMYENNRPGYLLMDLSIGSNEPVILMEDGMYPQYDTSETGYRQSIRYQIAWPKSPYILAVTYDMDSYKIISRHFYHVSKPYCSFMDVTFKPQLFNPIHGLLTRHDGRWNRMFSYTRAYVHIVALPLNILGKSEHYFTMATVNEDGDDQVVTTYSFVHLEANNNMKLKNALQKVSTNLRTNPEHLRAKLLEVKSTILNDSSLLQEIYKMNHKLNIIDVKPGETKPIDPMVFDPAQTLQTNEKARALLTALFKKTGMSAKVSALTHVNNFIKEMWHKQPVQSKPQWKPGKWYKIPPIRLVPDK